MANQDLVYDLTKVPELNKPQQCIYARVGDGGLKLVTVHLLSNGYDHNLTGLNVYFYGTKPDGTVIVDRQGGTILDPEHGIFRYAFPKEAFTAQGEYVQAFFKLMRGNQTDSTVDIKVVVEENLVEFGINSENYISDVEKVIHDVNEDKNNFVNDLNNSKNGVINDLTNQRNQFYNDLNWQKNDFVNKVNNDYNNLRNQTNGIQNQLNQNNYITKNEIYDNLQKYRNKENLVYNSSFRQNPSGWIEGWNYYRYPDGNGPWLEDNPWSVYDGRKSIVTNYQDHNFKDWILVFETPRYPIHVDTAGNGSTGTFSASAMVTKYFQSDKDSQLLLDMSFFDARGNRILFQDTYWDNNWNSGDWHRLEINNVKAPKEATSVAIQGYTHNGYCFGAFNSINLNYGTGSSDYKPDTMATLYADHIKQI